MMNNYKISLEIKIACIITALLKTDIAIIWIIYSPVLILWSYDHKGQEN